MGRTIVEEKQAMKEAIAAVGKIWVTRSELAEQYGKKRLNPREQTILEMLVEDGSVVRRGILASSNHIETFEYRLANSTELVTVGRPQKKAPKHGEHAQNIDRNQGLALLAIGCKLAVTPLGIAGFLSDYDAELAEILGDRKRTEAEVKSILSGIADLVTYSAEVFDGEPAIVYSLLPAGERLLERVKHRIEAQYCVQSLIQKKYYEASNGILYPTAYMEKLSFIATRIEAELTMALNNNQELSMRLAEGEG